MLYIKFIFCILLLNYGEKLFAQQNKLEAVNLENNLFFKKENPLLFFSKNEECQLIKQDYSFAKASQAIKRPMFCKMEDKLHKRFNVWILFRAGSDADYRKLIAQPQP